MCGFDAPILPDGTSMSVNKNEQPSAGFKCSAVQSDKQTSSRSSSTHINDSTISDTTNPTISLSELQDALPSNSTGKMPNMATPADFVESKHGITHFVEFAGLATDQANMILASTGTHVLDRVIRFQDGFYTTIWLVFDDIRLAEQIVSENDPHIVRFVPTEEALAFLGANKPYFKVAVSHTKSVNLAHPIGQISVSITHDTSKTPEEVHAAVVDLANTYGDPFVIALDGYYGGINWQFVIEYHAISSVASIIKSFGLETGQIITDGISARIHPAVIEHTPATPAPRREVQTSATGRTSWVGDRLLSRQTGGSSRPPTRPRHYQGPGGYGYGSFVPSTPSHPQSFSMPRSHHHLSGPGRPRSHDHSNQDVDIANIENGSDVRTTLMIRNLPRSFGYEDVQKVLDISSKGYFDFLYVRMDFSQSVNIGYAFVNFARPEYIVPFIKARCGKPWPFVAHRRLFEVSYATIQGQDCLIQKFRNSSVMAEFTKFRPKLLYTVDDHNIPAGNVPGDEAPFPEIDNRQKFARSVDNAKTIGLYPPRGFKGGHKARRPQTQFDRGTPGYLQDEAAYVQRSGRRFFNPDLDQHGYAGQVNFGPIGRPDGGYHQAIPRYIPALPTIDAFAGAEAYYPPAPAAYGYHFGAHPSGFHQY
ncbi:RNA recognition motif 2-domain-containing protein [Elsinoe ampelina]|uniref:RNA recognition motif 2-domain-containing protein n=1 Tax=Elsinoe ampelina TaxID=302913 RepID=A0A6A6G2A4_9PEZI|nr:RNA recognition motif 2-domain-containing protein [Elsinoe ampelina]